MSFDTMHRSKGLSLTPGTRSPRWPSMPLAAVHSWRAVLAVIAGMFLILAAIVFNGNPTVFTDTDDYYELGLQLTQGAIAVVRPPAPHVLTPQERIEARDAAEELHMGHTQMASRSAAYAMFLYPLEAIGTLWLMAAAQAFAAAWLLFLLWRAAVPAAPLWHFLGGTALLSVGTSLPFFAGFAMPDIFAAVTVIGVALLIIFWNDIDRRTRWIAGALLTFSITVHTSHLLLVVTLLPVAIGMMWWLGVGRRQGAIRLGSMVAALIVAWGFNAGYAAIVQANSGEALRHQPFLTARLLADGPGRDYLRHACATGDKYALCAFAHEPLDDSEDILWSDLKTTGVFLRSSYAMRLKLEDEEPRFVLGTLTYDPRGQLIASLRNWGRQLALYQVTDPIRDPAYYITDDYWGDTYLPDVIKRVSDCGPRGNQCALRLTETASLRWHGAVLGLSVLAIGWALVQFRKRPLGDAEKRLLAILCLVVIGVLLNAAVCGILSGPFARYQSRLVWLIPAMALLLFSALRSRRDLAPVDRLG